MKDETYFYVGQTVFNIDCGKGKVIEIKSNKDYPIIVKFDDEFYSDRSYTFDGKEIIGKHVTLFQQPINLPTNKPIIKLKKGDLVWVKDYEETQWGCRYFSHFTDFSRTKVACFTDQKKDGDLKEWRYYSEFENIPF